MRPTDHDLQLLEAYLDDELSADAVEALHARLIEEPPLGAALADLRAARVGRQAVFAAIEPGELEVADVVARVQRSVRSRAAWRSRVRESLRYVAAAACVTVGVMIGSRATQPTPTAPAGGTQVAMDNGTGGWVRPAPVIPVFEDPGPAQPVQFRRSLRPVMPATGQRFVVLTDDANRVIAVQPFESVAEAREFVDDLRRAAEQAGRTIEPVGPFAPPAAPAGPVYVPPQSPGPVQAVPVSFEEF